MEELGEAIKNGKPPCEDNWNSELYKYAGDSFYERIPFLKQHLQDGRNAVRMEKKYCDIHKKDDK